MKRSKIKGTVYSCRVNPRNILSNKLGRKSEGKSLHTALDFDIKHSSVVLRAKTAVLLESDSGTCVMQLTVTHVKKQLQSLCFIQKMY